MVDVNVARDVIYIGSFVLSIAVFTAKYLLPLNKTLVELTITIKALQNDLSELSDSNTRSHERIHSRIDANEKRLDEHDVMLEHLKTIHGE